jgi:hypothetical protein
VSGIADAATRLRVQRLLAAAPLEPDGLPPAAVLVVRSLRDPLPGRLHARRASLRAPPEWERAVRGALADRLRGAARPVRGTVTEGAGAVLFADQAELLAAFARDAAAGAAARRWWWAALLRGLPGGDIARLVALCVREARYVPAALAHLSAWGEAERVLAALPADGATRILAATARAWEVPALLAAFAGAPLPRPPPAGLASRGSSPEPAPPALADDPPPWETLVSPDLAPPSLGAERRALLGIGLALHRAPLVVRGAGFAAAFARWRGAAAAPTARPGPAAAEAPPPARPAAPGPLDNPPGGTGARLRPASRTADPLRPSASDAGAAGANAVAPGAASQAGAGRDSDDRVDAPVSRTPWPSPTDPPKRADASEPDGAIASATGPGEAESGAPRPASPDGRQLWLPASIEPEQARSNLCGAFYLVNVVRALGFFGVLETHFRLPPTVGGWGWIELLARRLLGPASAALAGDPVWRVLARLDGREDDEPAGAGFALPEVRALPDAWERLLVGGGDHAPEIPPDPPFSKGGTRVAAARREGGSGADLKSPFEKGGFRGIPSRTPTHRGGEAPAGSDLHRFLDLVVPFVRLRLEATLRVAGTDEPLETALFRRAGLVQTTRSHADVRMGLDQVTLPVRLAGLDASPGWVPELGRVVTFHFHERLP